MKQKRIRVRPISDEEGEEEKEDGDRRNSLRKSKKIKYIDDYDDEEEAEEEGEDEDQEGNEQPGPSTQNTHDQMEQENRLPITCGDKKGFLDVEKLSRASEIQSAEETEEDDVKDDDWHPGSEELALEREEGEEERVGAENGGEVVDSGDDKSKEEEDKMEKGEMEDEDVPAVTDNDNDNSDFEDRGTNLIISASVINTLKTVKIVIPRLQEAKTDRRSSCSEHPKEDGWCKSLVEDAQSEEERQHNSAPGGPFITAVMHTDPSEESGVPLIVGGVKEENGEEFMYSGERTDGQREIKAETGNSSRPLSAPAASSPDIKPDIVRKTKDNESVSNHNANLSISPVPLLSVTDTSFAGDMIADWEKEDFETKHCGKEKEWEREEHLDMSSSEASVQSIATVNFRDVISDRVTTQQGIKEERIEAMSPSTEPLSVLGDCQYDNPGHTDATSLGHDATQLQVMKLETRDPQTTQVSDSIYSSVMEEGPSSRLSANINLDTMDLDQLKREKIKMQLKVLKLQEEYYTRKLKEFKK
ncbi:midasin-like isoform X1 [Lates japonicus]|uniref:Midasin-like isoform X1 n=1 Tax=Lates japonicus TaxID=270547 RepID=A0AAD3MU87_LATJO|nr:midasin-like isoform X1 [Lates japonicus]